MAQYAHPETLVETQWVAEHGNDPGVRLVEVDVDTTAYDQGHIPGAIAWNWTTQLCDTVQRDIIPKDAFASLMASSGVGNDTTVILYGDNNNWFAAWALWQMKIYGHKDVRLMNGGRKKWLAEGRDLKDKVPVASKAAYKAAMCAARTSSPARCSRLQGCPRPASAAATSPARRAFPGDWPATTMALSSRRTSWRRCITARGSPRIRPPFAYCRIGERSSHTWYVLKYLLGHRGVTNYDGSWTEWGNMVRAPVERGPETAAV